MNGVWPKMGFAEPSVHLAALCPARRIFGDPQRRESGTKSAPSQFRERRRSSSAGSDQNSARIEARKVRGAAGMMMPAF
jgi:hypothetical protein